MATKAFSDYTFEELRKYKIDDYVKTRDGISYLPWAHCKALLHKLGAKKVFFTPVVNPETGSSLFMTQQEFYDSKKNVNRVYEVAVTITVDDDVFEMRTPVMNGANPVKDNSMSQQRVWASQCRAFVKGIAMRYGLGFSLWMKDDFEDDIGDDISIQDIHKYIEKLQRLFTTAVSLVPTNKTADLASALGYDEDDFKDYFKKYLNKYAEFEDALTRYIQNA